MQVIFLFVFCRLFLCPAEGHSYPWQALCDTELALLLCKYFLLGNSSKLLALSVSLSSSPSQSISSSPSQSLYLSFSLPPFSLSLLHSLPVSSHSFTPSFPQTLLSALSPIYFHFSPPVHLFSTP